jgi:hypothetical protein
MTDTFIESMSDFDKGVKASLWKCLSLLCKNHLHPSLNTEKLNGIFSSRINIDYRLIHEPIRDVFRLLFAGKHDDAYRFAKAYEQRRKFLTMPSRRPRPEESQEPVSRKPMAKLKEEKTLRASFRKLLHRFYNRRTEHELMPGQTYNLKELKKYFK